MQAFYHNTQLLIYTINSYS